jgi:hypothetical protein
MLLLMARLNRRGLVVAGALLVLVVAEAASAQRIDPGAKAVLAYRFAPGVVAKLRQVMLKLDGYRAPSADAVRSDVAMIAALGMTIPAGGATKRSPGRRCRTWPSTTGSACISRERALVSSTSITERIPAPAPARAPDASLQTLRCRREILAVLRREMPPLEETGWPHAAVVMDEALARLDDQPITAGIRARRKGVERAQELGR